MTNKSRNRLNQPAKAHPSSQLGEPQKLKEPSNVLQAQRDHSEPNLGTAEEEAAKGESRENPKRRKAGR